jgi:hypothetical protein
MASGWWDADKCLQVQYRGPTAQHPIRSPWEQPAGGTYRSLELVLEIFPRGPDWMQPATTVHGGALGEGRWRGSQ